MVPLIMVSTVVSKIAIVNPMTARAHGFFVYTVEGVLESREFLVYFNFDSGAFDRSKSNIDDLETLTSELLFLSQRAEPVEVSSLDVARLRKIVLYDQHGDTTDIYETATH